MPRINLAMALLETGDIAAARAALNEVDLPTVEAFPKHIGHARYRRIEGLLAEREGDAHRAETALRRAHRILDSTLGPTNWRTRQAKQDLDRITTNDRITTKASMSKGASPDKNF
jgi:hypothetical protein